MFGMNSPQIMVISIRLTRRTPLLRSLQLRKSVRQSMKLRALKRLPNNPLYARELIQRSMTAKNLELLKKSMMSSMHIQIKQIPPIEWAQTLRTTKASGIRCS